MHIITSGQLYIDIDAYAGCIAYAELLQLQGQEARAVSTSEINESVPPAVRIWPVSLGTSYSPSPDDTFVVIDVSEPEYFDKTVGVGQVTEIIDHHPGHEDYWHGKIGTAAQIEPVR